MDGSAWCSSSLYNEINTTGRGSERAASPRRVGGAQTVLTGNESRLQTLVRCCGARRSDDPVLGERKDLLD